MTAAPTIDRKAALCRCGALAFPDEDGDLTCSRCSKLLQPPRGKARGRTFLWASRMEGQR